MANKFLTSSLTFSLAGPQIDSQTMENVVAEVFSQKLHVNVPSHSSDLFESGVLDSLQLVELLFQLELQFRVRISLDEMDLENFRTIERITVMLVNQNGNGFRV